MSRRRPSTASALLARGPAHLTHVLADLRLWMDVHEWRSIQQMRGIRALDKVPDPGAYERANDMRMLQGWVEGAGHPPW